MRRKLQVVLQERRVTTLKDLSKLIFETALDSGCHEDDVVVSYRLSDEIEEGIRVSDPTADRLQGLLAEDQSLTVSRLFSEAFDLAFDEVKQSEHARLVPFGVRLSGGFVGS